MVSEECLAKVSVDGIYCTGALANICVRHFCTTDMNACAVDAVPTLLIANSELAGSVKNYHRTVPSQILQA